MSFKTVDELKAENIHLGDKAAETLAAIPVEDHFRYAINGDQILDSDGLPVDAESRRSALKSKFDSLLADIRAFDPEMADLLTIKPDENPGDVTLATVEVKDPKKKSDAVL